MFVGWVWGLGRCLDCGCLCFICCLLACVGLFVVVGLACSFGCFVWWLFASLVLVDCCGFGDWYLVLDCVLILVCLRDEFRLWLI